MLQRFIHRIGRCLPLLIAILCCFVFANCGDQSPQPLRPIDSSIGTIKAHVGPVTAVMFTPDGKQIVSAGRDGRLVVWDVASKTAVAELLGKGDQVRSAAITVDGKLIAAGNEKGVIKIFDLENRRMLQEINAGNDSILALAFDSKGKLLVSGGKDKQVKAWQIGAS